MKPASLFKTVIVSVLISNSSIAQQDGIIIPEEMQCKTNTAPADRQKHLNFFIVSGVKKESLTLLHVLMSSGQN